VGWRTTLALSVAVVLAAGTLWVDLRRANVGSLEWDILGEPRGEPPGEKIKRLLGFDPATITAIRLARDGTVVRVARANGGWVGAAEPRLLDEFLHNLQEMAEIAPLEVQADELEDYGLDPPQAVIELERQGGDPIVVLLGQHNPSATGAYVQLGKGGPVVLTGALMLWEFDKAFKATGSPGTPQAAGRPIGEE